MGFAPHTSSRKKVLSDGEIPTELLKAHGSSSKAAKVWPYLIMAVLTIGLSLLYYYAIFPAMEDASWSDGVVFGVSALYFASLAVLFYFVVEPALIKAFSKSGRYITHDEGKVMINIMNAVFFAVTFMVYVVFVRGLLNKRKEAKKKPEPKVTPDQTAQLLKLLEKANHIE